MASRRKVVWNLEKFDFFSILEHFLSFSTIASKSTIHYECTFYVTFYANHVVGLVSGDLPGLAQTTDGTREWNLNGTCFVRQLFLAINDATHENRKLKSIYLNILHCYNTDSEHRLHFQARQITLMVFAICRAF